MAPKIFITINMCFPLTHTFRILLISHCPKICCISQLSSKNVYNHTKFLGIFIDLLTWTKQNTYCQRMHLQSCVCRHLTGWSSTTLAGISQWYRIRMHEVDKWHERREIIAKRLQRFSLKLNNSHDTYTYNAKSCIIILTSYCTLSGTTATIVSSEKK